MVLSAIWTLAFGVDNPLPEDSLAFDHAEDGEDETQDHIDKILDRQRILSEAEQDILGTTIYLPAPNVKDEAAENKSGFILVVTSLTLNNIGCYPFFGIRDRHQVFPKLFPETSPRSSFQYLRQVYRSQGVLGICVEFLLYIPLYPLLRNSLLLRMDSHAGPWPANSSYLHLLRSFAVDYIHDLVGLFYSRGRSPNILPIYSTVLPSYVLNLVFEIIQTWIFRWIYPKLVPANIFSRKKSSKSGSRQRPPGQPPHLVSSLGSSVEGLSHTGSSGSGSNTTSPRQPRSRRHNGGRSQQQQQAGQSQPALGGSDPSFTVITATEISATIMAAMPTVSSTSTTTTTMAVTRARNGLRYLSTVAPKNPTLLQEFYPEMVCAMTSSMLTRVLLYPLDTVASRVSAQGGRFPGIGVAPTLYRGFWDCWIQSIRPQGGGILGLYSGIVDCIIVEAMVRWVVLEGTWFAHLVIKWLHRR
ncbi:hypothetical protein BGZ83_009839 [Gryganskiella cystojenkinii]|nr:hypothetical protein BGZ83_009839 [Gryganskiella cystojenkinii]